MTPYTFTSKHPIPGGVSISLTGYYQEGYIRFILFGKVCKIKYDRFIQLYQKEKKALN